MFKRLASLNVFYDLKGLSPFLLNNWLILHAVVLLFNSAVILSTRLTVQAIIFMIPLFYSPMPKYRFRSEILKRCCCFHTFLKPSFGNILKIFSLGKNVSDQ